MSEKKKSSRHGACDSNGSTCDHKGHSEKNHGSIAMQLLSNPEFMNAVQNDLNGLVGKSSGYIESLPSEVKRRIRALKKLQSEVFSLESKFHEEVHALELKYAALYEPIMQKRYEFVSGAQEPTEEESKWPEQDGDIENDEIDEKVNVSKNKDLVKGIPSFWLKALQSVDFIAETIKQYDEPILEFLTDIRVKFLPADNTQSFILEFEFATNPHFSNQILTKKYILRPGPDPVNPLAYEGPEIISCEGCKIDWKAGKNVTVKVIKRKPKNKKGPKRVITETFAQKSFFSFFNPPTVTEGKELSEDDEDALAEDYEIGHYIRERVIPRAVLYFTGEACEEPDFSDDEGEEGEGSESSDEENEDED